MVARTLLITPGFGSGSGSFSFTISAWYVTEKQIIICWEDFLLYIQYPKCSFLLFMPKIPQGLTLHHGNYFNSKWKLGFTYAMQIQNQVGLRCLYVRLYMHYCRQHPHKSDFLLLRWRRTAASDKGCGSCIHLLYHLTPKPWENVCLWERETEKDRAWLYLKDRLHIWTNEAWSVRNQVTQHPGTLLFNPTNTTVFQLC